MAKYTQDETKNTPPIGVIGPIIFFKTSGKTSANVSMYKEPENPTIPARNKILKILSDFSSFKIIAVTKIPRE
jgi:hypothetical protein